MLLSLEQLSFRRHGRDILRNITFDLPENHILTIIGPNGAGKSTLIALILGLKRPNGGVIRRRKNLRISFVPQKFNLPPDLPMTAGRFLADLPAEGRDYWLERLSIGKLLATPLQNLSGGECQRLLLARAFLRRPDLIVLDEPAAAIDLQSRDSYYQAIRDYQRDSRCSILLVSHDIYLVLKASHRVICLNQHICCLGTPEEVSRNAELNAFFGAEVGLYSHRHDHRH